MKGPMSTSILDDRQAIAQLDPSGALASAESIADQLRQVWEERERIQLQPQAEIRQVVVAGMGGSALGADLVKHLYQQQLRAPFEICRGYSLPKYVDQHTLVILSSYSGDTEETLACAKEAAARGAMIAVITAGGALAKLAKQQHYPHFLIEPRANPSNQPRMATAYNIMALLIMLSQAGLLEFGEEDYQQILDTVNLSTQKYLIEVPQERNQAKMLAYLCVERRPLLVGADFLEGALHIVTNQFNENAKTFADYKIVPELNHHLLEGLTFPKSNPLHHFFIFFQSRFYHPQVHKRLELTKAAVEKLEFDSLLIELEGDNPLTQAFELIVLGAFSNLYLAYLEGTDPCPIPMVDWFKAQLK